MAEFGAQSEVVAEVVYERPRTIIWSSAQADDMGARLKEPFSFSVERSTTGVPKYKMAGVMVTWPVGSAAAGHESRWEWKDHHLPFGGIDLSFRTTGGVCNLGH